MTISIRYFGLLLDFLIEGLSERGIKNDPWKTHLGVRRKQTSRIKKAAIARIGLGANDSDETIYWDAYEDDHNMDLRSENEYKIIFRGEPAVNYKDHGFWSLTVYGYDKFLVPNPDYKYRIRSTNEKKIMTEAPNSILLSRNKPNYTVNWIPLPSYNEKISAAFRCYRPCDELRTNSGNCFLPASRLVKFKDYTNARQ